MRERDANACPIIIVMGVAGSGKTTIGTALATRLGWSYCEGDEFHPQANLEKMRAGHALNDDDRAPWLEAIADWMDAQSRKREPAVIGCSALKRNYRDFLRRACPQVWFLYLRVPRAELERRVRTRHHQYMPPSLLDSQLDTIEEPASDEPRIITMDARASVAATARIALRALSARSILAQEADCRTQR